MFNSFSRLFRNDAKPTTPAVPPPQIAFHGERDGVVERQLKEQCVQLFRLAPGIRKAFFVNATRAGAVQPCVMLVLVSATEPDSALLRDLQKRAKSLLPAESPIEITALQTRDCGPIERVCTAFYFAA
jgi:SseB protein C-terminal domain